MRILGSCAMPWQADGRLASAALFTGRAEWNDQVQMGASAQRYLAVHPRQSDRAMSQDEARMRTLSLEEALLSGDPAALRSVALDPATLQMASLEEKASMLLTLSQDPAQGQAVLHILRSHPSPEEFSGLLDAVGVDCVHACLQAGPAGDPSLAGFNILAGSLDCADYASDAQQAGPGQKAREKGYSEDEIKKARERVEKVVREADDDDTAALADDTLCMLVATPSEKASMIKRLMKGHTNDKEDRAIVSILQSAENKTEFDAILKEAGGREVGEELDDAEAKKKFDHLVGGYDRMDLALDPKEAEKTRGALNEANQDRLLGGSREPAEAEAGSASGDPADDFQSHQRAKISGRVSRLDRRAQVETVCENAIREKEGKPLLDASNVRQQVEQIMNDPNLSKEQREQKVEELRKQSGLSEYTMRNLATQPISQIYQLGQAEAQGFTQAEAGQLRQQLAQAEAVYGADSPQAASLRAQVQTFEAKMGPYTERLGAVASELNEKYPPPTSFWDDVGGFLGKIAGFLPGLLNLIPGVGNLLYGVYQVGSALVSAAKGNFLGMLTGLAGAIPGVGSLLGGATGQALKTGSRVLQGAIGLEQSIESGNPLAMLGAASSLGGNFNRPKGFNEGLGYAAQGANVATHFASGDVLGGFGALNQSLGAFAPFTQASRYVGDGLQVADSIVTGNMSRAFQTVAADLPGGWTANPTVNRGLRVTQNVLDGDYVGALESTDLVNLGALRNWFAA